MSNENAVLEEEVILEDDYVDFEEIEEKLQNQLDEELSDLSFLEEEKDKIGNPDNLGNVVLDEIWKQFGNQIGLDITNETLIQKYDREHPESYDKVGKKVMQDKAYKEANKKMKDEQKSGKLKDEYTGKKIKQNDTANLDHVVSRKEIYENQRRKQANLSTEKLANKTENLKPTNESLNKSKKEKSVDEYISKREQREKDLKEQNRRAKEKIDNSNMSDSEKKQQKKNLDKRLQDKLDADDELMKKADKEARKAINKNIRNEAVKEVGKKAGKDALKTIAVTALFSMLKEIMNGLVRFFKSKSKSFNSFLSEMKTAITSFFKKIGNLFQSGASSFIGTVVSEIFGPIVSTFKKLASLIKQGISSVIDAIKYLKDESNKGKPLSIKIAQVGKIITSALVAGGAIFLGELFEKILESHVPTIMKKEIPLLGSLANVIGLFLASLISGVVGAIVINLIDKFIAKRQKSNVVESLVDKGNDILKTQREILDVNEKNLVKTQEEVLSNIQENHKNASQIIKTATEKIFTEDESDNQKDFDEIDSMLDDLLA